MESKQIELIKSYYVQWASWEKKWYGNGIFIIEGCEIKWNTAYFDTFDEAANAAKIKSVEVLERFCK